MNNPKKIDKVLPVPGRSSPVEALLEDDDPSPYEHAARAAAAAEGASDGQDLGLAQATFAPGEEDEWATAARGAWEGADEMPFGSAGMM